MDDPFESVGSVFSLRNLNYPLYFCTKHIEHFAMDIESTEYFSSSRIYGKTMVVEDIIVFEDMFAYIEVPTFYLFLYRSDILHEHLTLYEWISLWV